MWPIVLQFVMNAISVLPSLVTDIENLWRGRPKSGPQKWLSVEEALSQIIAETAKAVASIAPPGTKTEEISAALVIFTKAVNDASVALANTLKIFPHGSTPAISTTPPPK